MITEDSWIRLRELRYRAKHGYLLEPDEQEFCVRMQRDDPARYAKMSVEITQQVIEEFSV